MKSKLAILLTTILIAGCDVQAQAVLTKSHVHSRIREVCVDGVIYLVLGEGSRGGITPKINADFYPYTCNSNQGVKNE